MINPYLKSLNENTVTLLASNVTACIISKLRLIGRDMSYIMTYRLTGQAAPSLNQMKKEGVLMFQKNSEREDIEASAAIDIYCYCNNGDNTDSKFGKLAVWSGINPILSNLLSINKDSILQTSCLENYIMQGKGFAVDHVFTVGSGDSEYDIVIDTTGVTREKYISFPSSWFTSAGPVIITFGSCTSYSSGTNLPILNRNDSYQSSYPSQSVIKYDVTLTGFSASPISLLVGASSTPLYSGGGTNISLYPICLTPGGIQVFRVNNLAGENIYLQGSLTWFEV